MDLKLDENGCCEIDGKLWKLVPCDPSAAQVDAALEQALKWVKGNAAKARAFDGLMTYQAMLKASRLPHN